MNLAYRWLNNPEYVEIEPEHKTSELVDERFMMLTESNKFEALLNVLADDNTGKVIVFANRKDQVKRLYDRLRQTLPSHQDGDALRAMCRKINDGGILLSSKT